MEEQKMHYTQEEWSYALFSLSEYLASHAGIMKEFKKIYATDPSYYYQEAQNSMYYNNMYLTSYPIAIEQNIKIILGILYAAEENDDILKKVFSIIKRNYPIAYEAFRKSSKPALQHLSEKLKKDDQALPPPLSAYLIEKLLPSTSGNPTLMLNFCEKHQDVDWVIARNSQLYKQEDLAGFLEDTKYTASPENKAFIDLPRNPYDWAAIISIDTANDISLLHNRPELKQRVYAYAKAKNHRLEDTLLSNKLLNTIARILNMFDMQGLNCKRLFSDSPFLKDVNIQAAQLSGKLIGNINKFDEETYIYMYFIASLIRCYHALKKEYNKLAPEAQALISDATEGKIHDLEEHLKNEKKQNQLLRNQIETLEQKINALQKNQRIQQWDIEKNYTEKIDMMQEELDALRQNKHELSKLRSLFFNLQNAEPSILSITSEQDNHLDMPLLEKMNIITVGGHVQLRKNIKSRFPTFTVLDGTLNSQNFDMIEQADHVFLLFSNMSHSVYYKLMEQLKKFKTPFSYISKTHINLIEEEMLKTIMDESIN
jgi:hypothetical protein